MSEIKSLMDVLHEIEESSELMEASDTFTFELGEEGDECLIETGIVSCGINSVIVEADEETLKILSEHFILEDFEELDEDITMVDSASPQDFYKEFINSQNYKQAVASNTMKGDSDFKTLATQYLQAKGLDPNKQQDTANKMSQIHDAYTQSAATDANQAMFRETEETDEAFDRLLKYSGLNEPTKQRIEKGVTQPVDRTDFDIPAFLRKADKTGQKLSPEVDKLSKDMYKEEELDERMVMGKGSDASSAGSYLQGESEEVEEGLGTKLGAGLLGATLAMNPMMKANTPTTEPVHSSQQAKIRQEVGQFVKRLTGQTVNTNNHAQMYKDIEKVYVDQYNKLDDQNRKLLAITASAVADDNQPVSDNQTFTLHKLGLPVPNTTNEDMDEAKYHGREVPLGKKMKGDVKKSKVYVRKPNGKIVKVNFGDKNMRIKKSNPKRRKSFRARHNCKNPGPRWKARYWSCRSW